jgi:hypothetical protein
MEPKGLGWMINKLKGVNTEPCVLWMMKGTEGSTWAFWVPGCSVPGGCLTSDG